MGARDLPYGLMARGAAIAQIARRAAWGLAGCALALGLMWGGAMKDEQGQGLPAWPYRDAAAPPAPFVDVLLEIEDLELGFHTVDVGFWNGRAWVLSGAPGIEVNVRRWAPVPKPEPEPRQ